jgi:hypothetical protein
MDATARAGPSHGARGSTPNAGTLRHGTACGDEFKNALREQAVRAKRRPQRVDGDQTIAARGGGTDGSARVESDSGERSGSAPAKGGAIHPVHRGGRTASGAPSQFLAAPRHLRDSIKTIGRVSCEPEFWEATGARQADVPPAAGAAQHPPRAARGFGVAARLEASANCGGSTPRARAQAIRSAGVWQQHERQHCSAVRQPHVRFMQGKGCEGSLTVGTGSGTPAAVKASAATAIQAVAGRHTFAPFHRCAMRASIACRRRLVKRGNRRATAVAMRAESRFCRPDRNPWRPNAFGERGFRGEPACARLTAPRNVPDDSGVSYPIRPPLERITADQNAPFRGEGVEPCIRFS